MAGIHWYPNIRADLAYRQGRHMRRYLTFPKGARQRQKVKKNVNINSKL